MSISLEQSLQNRRYVIDGVREELIGPARIRDYFERFNPIGTTQFESKEELYKPRYWEVGETREEILQRESPTQRYVSGQLFPIGSRSEENESVETKTMVDDAEAPVEVADEDSVDRLFNETPDIESTEDDGDIELFPQRNDFMPSSIGLTFSLSRDVGKINVVVSGGIYTPHTVRVKGEDKGYEWWLREGISGSVPIDVEILAHKKDMDFSVDMFNTKEQKIPYLNMQVQARLRIIKDSYVTTVSLTNRSLTGTMRREQLILFQSELAVCTPSGHSLSVYPKQYQLTQQLGDEEASTELLYRNEGIFAFGHGCAADWDQNSNEPTEIRTSFLPEYETISMTPDVETESGTVLKLRMSDFAGLSSSEHPKVFLQPLIEEYRKWIVKKEKGIPRLTPVLQDAARKHMALCMESLQRMVVGLQLLDDEKILKAFRLANVAMLLQQKNGTKKRNGKIDGSEILFDAPLADVVWEPEQLKDAPNSWRAFQIAFFLMSIAPMSDATCSAREIVDLIWFPTGGGKTEAYLGVAAFQMILRRLRNPLDAGVDVIMRYTLRLLTADQFERSSRLMCALEYIRSKHSDELGDTPFSIGIWVGSDTTPNRNTKAGSMLRSLLKNERNAESFVVRNCPWCGAELGHYPHGDKKVHLGYRMKNERLVIHCPDKSCFFHEELPIYIVDETIYERRPTFIIGTIDKFVQLVWEPRGRALFGIDRDGKRFVSPPNLIIQDELHLISGPLGSLSGLFEVLIEELCITERQGHVVKPKIIAATATIKQFEEQCRALFGRTQARLFPSPGLEHNDSFFSSPARDAEGRLMPGRRYVGVYTTNVRIMMAQVMTFSSILQSASELPDDERDPYWTLLAFYNTLRELGGGLTLTQTDIPQYSWALQMRRNRVKDVRYITNWLELTSRKQSHEISKTIGDLKAPYSPKNKKAIDLCLASNIIEVGVDIDRLSVMAIVGQPKMTAQYIQVSGRVGRRWWERPGVIFTVYSNTKSRDKSHFEHFREYHQRLYAQVEPTSVTPFSDSCLERGLQAIIIGFIRQGLTSDIARVPDMQELGRHLETKIVPFYNRLIQRVTIVDPEQVEEVKDRFRKIVHRLRSGAYTGWRVDAKVNGFMYPAGSTIPISLKKGATPMMNSMRSVDAECRGVISANYYNEKPQDLDISWEELFK